jgi:hypothetical protein
MPCPLGLSAQQTSAGPVQVRLHTCMSCGHSWHARKRGRPGGSAAEGLKCSSMLSPLHCPLAGSKRAHASATLAFWDTCWRERSAARAACTRLSAVHALLERVEYRHGLLHGLFHAAARIYAACATTAHVFWMYSCHNSSSQAPRRLLAVAGTLVLIRARQDTQYTRPKARATPHCHRSDTRALVAQVFDVDVRTSLSRCVLA